MNHNRLSKVAFNCWLRPIPVWEADFYLEFHRRPVMGSKIQVVAAGPWMSRGFLLVPFCGYWLLTLRLFRVLAQELTYAVVSISLLNVKTKSSRYIQLGVLIRPMVAWACFQVQRCLQLLVPQTFTSSLVLLASCLPSHQPMDKFVWSCHGDPCTWSEVDVAIHGNSARKSKRKVQ